MGRSGLVLVGVVLLALACGESATSTGGGSGVEGKRMLRDLGEDDLRRLCDWSAQQGGGYGRALRCDGGVFARTQPDQNTCVDSFRRTDSCVATVADVETCTRKKAEQPCDFGLGSWQPQCQAVLTCD